MGSLNESLVWGIERCRAFVQKPPETIFVADYVLVRMLRHRAIWYAPPLPPAAVGVDATALY